METFLENPATFEPPANEKIAIFPTIQQKINLQMLRYPKFRYMGSKAKLIPWITDVLSTIDFSSVWEPFAGSCVVSYLMKSMEKRVVVSDFLNFPTVIAHALIENPGKTFDMKSLNQILRKKPTSGYKFIEKTFKDVFFKIADLKFLDRISSNIRFIEDPHIKSIAMAALLRSCLKKQPRGVFTISGDLSNYDDGRRDLQLSIEEHFLEQIEAINTACFHNGLRNRAIKGSVFELKVPPVELVYLDPPYVPSSDDNCYIKRYHFLEGLSCYWKDVEIDYSTKTKKIAKKYTPFSYRSDAIGAFDKMFHLMKNKKIVLSYSSNAFPSLQELVKLMEIYKSKVDIYTKPHRYHFGTHSNVKRAETTEYLIVGQ